MFSKLKSVVFLAIFAAALVFFVPTQSDHKAAAKRYIPALLSKEDQAGLALARVFGLSSQELEDVLLFNPKDYKSHYVYSVAEYEGGYKSFGVLGMVFLRSAKDGAICAFGKVYKDGNIYEIVDGVAR